MRNISLQKTSVLTGVFFCWLLFFLMCSEAKAQSNWTNAGGAMQQKVVAGDTSIRFTKLSSYGAPFYITDELKKKLTINSDSSINVGGVKLRGITTFSGISGKDLIIGGNLPDVSSARIAVIDSIKLNGEGHHAFGDYSIITQTANGSSYASMDAKPNLTGPFDWDHGVGIQSRIIFSGTGNINSRLDALNAIINHEGTGTIANTAGLRIYDPQGTGPITDNVGLYIRSQTRGINSNYAIKTESGNIWFGGDNLSLGDPYYDLPSYKVLSLGTETSPGLIKFKSSYNSGNGAELYQNHDGTIYLNINPSQQIATIGIDSSVNFFGTVSSNKYTLSDLNTAPSSSTGTGVKGEIRITSDYIYVCVATDTWVRSALTTW